MRRIVLTGVPPFEVQDLAGPLEVFSQCDYEVELVSTERDGAAGINRGLRVTGGTHFRSFDEPIDTLWVVGGPEAPSGAHDPAYLRWLKEQAGRARRVGASCLGTFVLAAAGVLDGRRAVTHWQWCDHLAARHPRIELVRESIYVKDGHVYTSAGITTGIDLALLFVEEDFGPRKALAIAQWLVLFVRRTSSSAQLSKLLTLHASAIKPFDDLENWIFEHLAEEIGVERMAASVNMSARQFTRVFRHEKGTTPARFVERVRVEVARSLLEASGASVKAVAAKCGFGSADSMRRSFLRVLGATPSEIAGGVRVAVGAATAPLASPPAR
ncbi:MAG: DJ-1/PfpI family protein [Rubrivivax sp.]|nr:DJ-1/PfpI family protein [Rubrivivax sp.]